MKIGWLVLGSVLIIVNAVELTAAPSHPRPSLRYDVSVSVTGRITARQEYGPPNYGENPDTDEKDIILILHPDKPISVEPDRASNDTINTQSFSDVREVQLGAPPKLKLSSYVGKHVAVTGTLFERITSHHYTDVLMDVSRVQLDR